MNTVRYAWRSLAKSPGFVVISVLALGIGLGLSTTMFAVLDAVVNPEVAYRDPGTLYSINWWFGRRNPMRPAELYRYFRDQTHSFEGVVPVAWDQVTIDVDGQQSDFGIRRVTPNWFTLTGIKPKMGRGLVASDGEDAVVLSYDLWKRIFGTRRTLSGAAVTISGRPVPVVGVLPRGAGRAEGWMALPANIEGTGIAAATVRPFVRLRAGVSREQADAEIKALARQLTDRFGAREAPFSFDLYPAVNPREEVKDIHKAMIGAALAVLLIACVNLAHLMLARGLAKRREFALRMALGASRGAVVRQMFTECAFITVAGAALGALIGYWGADILENRMPPEVAWVGLVRPQLSWRVFALGAAAAALSAVFFGLGPAIRVAFGVNLDEPLKDDAGTTTGRIRYKYNPLVMAEVGLALVLLMAGGLLLRTVHGLQGEREDANEETLWRGFIYQRYEADAPKRTQPSRDAIRGTLAGIAGIRDMAFEGGRNVIGGAVSAELTQDSNRTIIMRTYPVVSPAYLKVRGLPILRGRDFEPGDAAGSGVAIVDALAAQTLYPGEEAVGRMLKLGSPASSAPWVRIVGVSRSPKHLEGDERYAPEPNVWVSSIDSAVTPQVLIRTASPDPAVVATAQQRLRQQLPGISAYIIPWNYSRKAEIASRGFLAKVFVAMGAVALALSALGLYGVLAYTVTRRMREFAVRIALGAAPERMLRMVLHDGFVMLLAGIGVGAFGALAASRMLDSVLIAVLPSDVVSLVISETVLIAAGLAAALVPARRASRANPMDILRAT